MCPDYGLCGYRLCCVCRLSKIKEWVDRRDPHALIIPFSAGLELKVYMYTYTCTYQKRLRADFVSFWNSFRVHMHTTL